MRTTYVWKTDRVGIASGVYPETIDPPEGAIALTDLWSERDQLQAALVRLELVRRENEQLRYCQKGLEDEIARLESVNRDLQTVLEELEESSGYWSEYDVPLGIVDRIRAALAKARGEG